MRWNVVTGPRASCAFITRIETPFCWTIKSEFDRTVYLLDVIPGARVIGELKDSGKAVEAVPNCDIDSLPEDPVPPLAVGDDLGVPPGDVEHDGVHGPRDRAPHLDVRDAVVDRHEWLPPEEGERAGGRGGDLERAAHAGAFRVADAGEVGGGDAGVGERGAEEREEVHEVVLRGLAGKEAVARRGHVGMARVGEDLAREGDHADADLVGRGLQPQRQRARGAAARRRRRRGHGGGGGRVLGVCAGRRVERRVGSSQMQNAELQRKSGPLGLLNFLSEGP